MLASTVLCQHLATTEREERIEELERPRDPDGQGLGSAWEVFDVGETDKSTAKGFDICLFW